MNVIENFNWMGEENAFAVLARANQLAAQGKDIINLGIGQPDFKTPEHIVEAAIKAMRDGEHGYTAAPGIEPLREAVAADLHQRYQVNVSPENVMIMPGAKPVMFAAILMFGRPGVEILYPDPGFPIYRSLIEFTGATPIPVPIREQNNFTFSAEETLSLITQNTTLLIVNSPANPTGGVTPKTEIDALVKGLQQHPELAILSDEIYDQLIYDGKQHTTLLSYPEIADRLIVLNGWSKTYAMTGWRLGYAVLPPILFDYVRKLAVNSWSCVNTPSQYAALAALTGAQDAVNTMRCAFDERRRALVSALNEIDTISCVMPTGAFYAFPNITQTNWQAKPLANALLEEMGIATVSGTDFGVFGEGYLRLSYANSIDNCLAAVERIREFLER